MKRFYYSATRESSEFDGVIRAPSIDLARETLLKQGFEEISLSILTSSAPELDDDEAPEGTSSSLRC